MPKPLKSVFLGQFCMADENKPLVREYSMAELKQWAGILTERGVSFIPIQPDPRSIDEALRVTRFTTILGCFKQERSPLLGRFGGLVLDRGEHNVYMVRFQFYASFGEKRFPDPERHTRAWEYSARTDSLSKLYKVV